MWHKNLFYLILLAVNLSFTKERLLPQLKAQEKNNKKVTILGTITLPEEVDCPYIYLSYKGKLIKIKNEDVNTFSIRDFDCCQINLLFVSAHNLTLNTETNTILNIAICDHTKYKFYELDKKTLNNFGSSEQIATWQIKQQKLGCIDNQMTIPLNTIIILLDPNCIDFKLKNTNFKLSNNVIDLPKIIIKDIININQFEKSCLAFLDLKPFHGETETKSEFKQNVKLQMLKS